MFNFVNFRANLVEFEVRKVISCCATLEQSDNISVKTLNIVKIYEKLELSMSKPLSGQGRFSDSFEIFETLGKGAFSIVKRCRSKEGHNKGKDFAVKIIKTKELIPKIVSKLDKESRICKALKHPNIVSLHVSFQV